jgi:biopolymer transport protein ExbD
MKLHSYLPQQGLRLYIAPLLNGALLLLIFFLLESSVVIQSGVSVKLPESASRISGFDRAHIITVSAMESGLYFDGRPVSTEELRKNLEKKKGEGRRVIIHADAMAPFGRVLEVSNAALAMGYEIAYATQPPQTLAQ